MLGQATRAQTCAPQPSSLQGNHLHNGADTFSTPARPLQVLLTEVKKPICCPCSDITHVKENIPPLRMPPQTATATTLLH